MIWWFLTRKKEIAKFSEIKHSTEAVPKQCRHLLDEEKCRDTEFRYGPIVGKYVIYIGATMSAEECCDVSQDVSYLNVEEYLKGLKIMK